MNIIVLGASQGTGALAVQEALDRGHSVTAFARSPEKLALESPKLKKVKGNFHDRASVFSALKGHDSVIITASPSLSAFKENPNYFSQGTEYVIAGMKEAGIRGLVVLSALGTGESRPLSPFLARLLLVDGILKRPFADHARQEKLVRESGLNWVIARPGRLTNGPAEKRYVKQDKLEAVPISISRADVADFLVEAATSDRWIGKAVQLGG